MLTRLFQIAAKKESVEGTAETLTSSEVVDAFNPSFKPGIEAIPQDVVCTSLSPLKSIMGMRQAELSFDVNLVGASAAGGTVPYAVLLEGCKLEETLVAGTSATYLPVSSGDSSLTLGFYLDGKKYLMC